jgi:hypothetical protein
VGDSLYRLHGSIISNASNVLEDMFAMPPPSELEADGFSINQPIVLPHITEALFEEFLSVIYGRCVLTLSSAHYRFLSHFRWKAPPFSTHVLVGLIDLSDKWACPLVRNFSVHHIKEQCYHFHPTELIRISVAYKVQELFEGAF